MRLVTPLLVPLLVIAALPRVPEAPVALTLRSSAFAAGAAIPAQYTCDGANQSPPLEWSGAPEGTKSFALIVDDPDAPDPKAPKMTWVHWVLYDIPAGTAGLEAGSDPSHLPAGTRAGTAIVKDIQMHPARNVGIRSWSTIAAARSLSRDPRITRRPARANIAARREPIRPVPITPISASRA